MVQLFSAAPGSSIAMDLSSPHVILILIVLIMILVRKKYQIVFLENHPIVNNSCVCLLSVSVPKI